MKNRSDLEKLNKMQEDRITRLYDIALSMGRISEGYDNPLIAENIERAQDENNKADAEYFVGYNYPF